MDRNTDPDVQHFLDLIAVNLVLVAVALFVLWLLIAAIAGWVAPEDRQSHFFWCTLLVLGPLGVAVALLAQPRDYDR